jgi:hypothetical protein
MKISPREAVLSARRGLAMFDELLKTNSDDGGLVIRRARAATRLAQTLLLVNEAAEARRYAFESVETHRRLLSGGWADRAFRTSMARALAVAGQALHASGDRARAQSILQEAVDMGSVLLSEQPPDLAAWIAGAYAFESMAKHFEATRRDGQALTWYERNRAVWTRWSRPSSYVDRRRREADELLTHVVRR